jgi:7-carboxy-7-deazaguanine synthase
MNAMNTLMVNEIFYSIQGESTRAGLPCVFVRLMGCHLRCGYCDTEYAFHEGKRRTLDEVIGEVETKGGGCELVEITGGEPLLQPATPELMRRLSDRGCTVLVETSGACDITACDPRAIRIMDLKTPGSGESERNDWRNIDALTQRDEVKFVLTSQTDYEWARNVIERYDLTRRAGAVLMSAVHEQPPGSEVPGSEGLSMRQLAEWILNDRLPVRLQTQLHKLIWDPLARGV